MMKLQVKIPQKTRAHRVLWDRDLPFRPKTEQSKTQYRRKAKHPNREIA